ncbi:MAG: TIGR02680 family protein [Sporolactobacillus sp.]
MNEEKWVLNRAGVINFWYYDVAYFDFADGKMLLRGANGSGKSVTMSSLITVLLDGKKSPDRLDPFGSSARKMEDYLLGEEEVTGRTERTGYLFLEYKRKGLEQYLTTGMGMQARRHKSMNTWYFVMTDNRRMGIDFDLYRKVSTREIVPLTRQELANRIGGQVTSSQTEYMRRVNELIFGFDNVDLYDDLIKLLIQLRRPKLSKDFKPTVIYDILQQSLPALKADDLHSVADTLEQIDQARQQLEQAKTEYRLMSEVTDRYQKYRDYCLRELSFHLHETTQTLDRDQELMKNTVKAHDSLVKKLANCQQDYDRLEIEMTVLAKEREELSHHEVFQLVGQQQTLANTIQGTKAKLAKQDDKLRRKQNQMDALKQKIEEQELVRDRLKREIQTSQLELSDLAESAHFSEHRVLAEDFQRIKEDEDNFHFWKNKIKDYRIHLREIQKLLASYEQRKEELRHEDSRLGQQIQKVADVDRDVRQWNETFLAEKDKLEIALQKWRESVHFSIDEQQWAQLLQGIDALYDEMTLFDDALQPIKAAMQTAEKAYLIEDAAWEQQLKAEEQRKKDLVQEKAEWLNKKDPEPERSDETRAFRAQLAERRIDARPLYELIDFAGDTPQPIRDHLEAALLEAGYLDALVSTEELKVSADRQLKPKPLLFAQTLSDYLIPDCPADSQIPVSLVQSVIDSIQLDGEDSLIVDEQGHYRLPALVGRASESYQAAYIGKASRDAFRQREIERLNQALSENEEQIAAIKQARATLAGAVQTLEAEMAAHPSDSEMKYAFEQRSERETAREREIQYKDEIEERLDQKKQEVALLKNRLNEQTVNDDLPLVADAYAVADKAFAGYQESFSEFTELIRHQHHCMQLIEVFDRQRSADEEEYEEIFQEVNDQQAQLKQQNLELDSVIERLKLKNAEEVRTRLGQVLRDLDAGEKRKPELAEARGSMKKEIEKLAVDGTQYQQRVTFFSQLKRAWEEAFRNLYRLDHRQDEALPEELQEIEATLLKNFKVDTERKKRLAADFETKFREVYGQLLDYHLQINDRRMAAEAAWMREEWPTDLSMSLELWRDRSHQQLFECDYLGARTSPQFVIEKLEASISQQSVLLEAQDQQLFEDIIYHSVGVTLRSLIDRSEKWVKQMNTILVGQQNSSHLTLSIAWKPRAAETEDELDTQDLVSLLRRDAQLLTQEDLEKMIRHFRAKIEACKQRVQDDENDQSLDQVLREVLDYRQWFTFELSYRKGNEPKRELTNHHFYRFSGGEKAISMYLPLYTAVYARYLDAGKNAPYIIALDEAFAGVDELNIAEQFRALEQLGFNYMMNSQALFGDYETVPSLNVYELVHAENDPFVMVIPYHWNGRERQLIDEKEEQTVSEK